MKANELNEFIEKNVGPEVVVNNTYGECMDGYFSPVIDTEWKGFKLLCPRFLGDIPYYVDLDDVKKVVLKGSDERTDIAPRIQKFKISNVNQLKTILNNLRGKDLSVEFLNKNNQQIRFGTFKSFTGKSIMVECADIRGRRMMDILINPEEVGFISIFDINAIFGNGATMEVD